MQKQPLGCWILVYPRGRLDLETLGQVDAYRNHYNAKRLITTEDFHGNGVPHNFFMKVRGIDAARAGVTKIGEDVFFLGRFCYDKSSSRLS